MSKLERTVGEVWRRKISRFHHFLILDLHRRLDGHFPHFDRPQLGLKMFNVYFSANAKDVKPIFGVFAREIWPIFAPNIRHFNFTHGHTLENFRRIISPTSLSDLNQLISIHSDYLLPDSIADDGPNATAGQALSKWLHIPRSDGQPKQLMCSDYEHTSETTGWLNSFKEAFLCANTSSSVSYVIRIKYFEPTQIGPFKLINERTNEKLTLKKENDFDCVLKRCQIGKTIQWEDKKTNNLNKITFELFGTASIGPLSPSKAEQINAKKSFENECRAQRTAKEKVKELLGNDK